MIPVLERLTNENPFEALFDPDHLFVLVFPGLGNLSSSMNPFFFLFVLLIAILLLHKSFPPPPTFFFQPVYLNFKILLKFLLPEALPNLSSLISYLSPTPQG